MPRKKPSPAISAYLAKLGRKGGKAKSEAKTAANRQNAKKKRPGNVSLRLSVLRSGCEEVSNGAIRLHKKRSAATFPVTAAGILTVMADDAFYSPNYRPTPRTVKRTGERLWEVLKDHVRWSCWLRYHGEWGVEAQIFRDGEIVIGRRFETRALAVQWAKSEEVQPSSPKTKC